MSDPTGGTYRDSWMVAHGERGRLHHVRGVVDGQLVVRRYVGRWRYSIVAMPRYAYQCGGIREPSPRLRRWLETELPTPTQPAAQPRKTE